MTRSIHLALSFLFFITTAAAQQYVISTYAGGAVPPAIAARALDVPIHWPNAVALDRVGNVYFASGDSVFKLDAGGTVIRVAGASRAGYSGDGGPATSAQLNPGGLPSTGLAVDR